MSVAPLPSLLAQRVEAAMSGVAPDAPIIAAMVRRSDHADFQADGVLRLAAALGRAPRELAAAVADRLSADAVLADCAVAGPGFVNLTLTDDALVHQVGLRLADHRLGVGRPESGTTTVVDYSQPNIAKEMHVGHLRSTVIGDALVRVLEHLGGRVVRRNHVGDWGTQFGMMIQYREEHPDRVAAIEHPQGRQGPRSEASAQRGQRGTEPSDTTMTRLAAQYRDARIEFDRNPDFADRARRRVVALQTGDPDTLVQWRDIVAESTVYFNGVYALLGVRLQPADVVGESFYNPMLPGLAEDLAASGIAVESDGALCVFFADLVGKDGTPTPLIVRKRDGGFGYAATDLAAIQHRARTLGADRIVYVVDARQSLHFRMVFDTARRAGWLPESVAAVHAAFGTVLGPDGRPFKTRSGETVRLVDLLSQAVERAGVVVEQKSPQAADPDRLARQLGIGAVKYADLATSRTQDYLFDLDRMVSLAGNTSVYLQYAYARCESILAKAAADGPPPKGDRPAVRSAPPLTAQERALVLALDGFGDAVEAVAATLEPHRLCTYLYGLAQTFTAFFEHCPVRRAEGEVRARRLDLCRLTAHTLRTGLGLLGVATPYPL